MRYTVAIVSMAMEGDVMPTLNARDVTIKSNPPDGEYLIIQIKQNTYAIYSDGRLWSFRLDRFQEPEIDYQGYRIQMVGGYNIKLHRLMLIVFDRPPTYGEQGRHLDGGPSNNHRLNLEWGTGEDNWEDRKRHGRIGAEWNRLLTNEQALSVYNDPRPVSDIAKEYGIQRNCVLMIKEKETYKDIHNV